MRPIPVPMTAHRSVQADPTAAVSTGLDASHVCTLIRPPGRWALPDAAELWRYRDLWWTLAKRDVQVRYKQAVLGAFWAIVQPFTMMVIVSTFLGPITGVSDPVTLYAGLLPWTFFASCVALSSSSLLANASMIQKVYFPRLILPLASIGAPLLDYLLGMGVFAVLLWWYQTPVGVGLLLVPLLVASTAITALSIGVLVSCLTVRYRDFRYVVPFLTQVLFFASPVIVTADKFPPWVQTLMPLNPIGGTISAIRAAVLNQPVDYAGWAVSVCVSLGLLGFSVVYFTRVERKFADVV